MVLLFFILIKKIFFASLVFILLLRKCIFASSSWSSSYHRIWNNLFCQVYILHTTHTFFLSLSSLTFSFSYSQRKYYCCFNNEKKNYAPFKRLDLAIAIMELSLLLHIAISSNVAIAKVIALNIFFESVW